jgi:hypothetical protein
MQIGGLPHHGPMRMAARMAKKLGAALAVAVTLLGCSRGEREAFERSHDAVKTGMSVAEMFDAGLADYLSVSGVKNAPGATLPERQPVSADCRRHVLDVSFSRGFIVRLHCDRNEPGASELVPERVFADKRQLIDALGSVYASYAADMEFRVESPPRSLFGIFDHYLVRTGPEGRVVSVSPVMPSPARE